jgi:Adenine-specific methyltransferase EcoRI
LVKCRNVAWFTNLDTSKRHEDLILYKAYNPDEYPTYGNYDAIEVAKVADVPFD